MARDLWTAAVARADALAKADAAASTLLVFAAALLRAQRDIYTHLQPGGGDRRPPPSVIRACFTEATEQPMAAAKSSGLVLAKMASVAAIKSITM